MAEGKLQAPLTFTASWDSPDSKDAPGPSETSRILQSNQDIAPLPLLCDPELASCPLAAVLDKVRTKTHSLVQDECPSLPGRPTTAKYPKASPDKFVMEARYMG